MDFRTMIAHRSVQLQDAASVAQITTKTHHPWLALTDAQTNVFILNLMGNWKFNLIPVQMMSYCTHIHHLQVRSISYQWLSKVRFLLMTVFILNITDNYFFNWWHFSTSFYKGRTKLMGSSQSPSMNNLLAQSCSY